MIKKSADQVDDSLRDMEVRNLRAEVNRLQESMQELSVFKTRLRAQNEIDQIQNKGNISPSRQDPEISRLKELLAERSEQVAKLAADNEVLTQNNKKIIDGMLKNELSFSGKLVYSYKSFLTFQDVPMILSVQSHTIELLLGEKILLNHQIKRLEMQLESLKNQETRDVQMQTPKIKLDMNWLHSMSQKKDFEQIQDFENQPFELVNQEAVPTQQTKNPFHERKVSNFGTQCEFEQPLNEDPHSDLQTYRFQSISYSPEKPQSILKAHLNPSNFAQENKLDLFQLQKKSLSEIKEGIENSDIFASGVQTDHQQPIGFSIQPELESIPNLPADYLIAESPELGQKNYTSQEFYDEYDVPDPYDEFDPLNKQTALQKSNLAKLQNASQSDDMNSKPFQKLKNDLRKLNANSENQFVPSVHFKEAEIHSFSRNAENQGFSDTARLLDGSEIESPSQLDRNLKFQQLKKIVGKNNTTKNSTYAKNSLARSKTFADHYNQDITNLVKSIEALDAEDQQDIPARYHTHEDSGSSVDTLQEILQDGEDLKGQDLNHDSILTDGELKFPESPNNQQGKPLFSNNAINRAKIPSQKGSKHNSGNGIKQVDEIEMSQKALLEARLKQAELELQNYSPDIPQQKKLKKIKSQKFKKKQVLNEGPEINKSSKLNYGENYGIPQAKRNLEQIKQSIADSRKKKTTISSSKKELIQKDFKGSQQKTFRSEINSHNRREDEYKPNHMIAHDKMHNLEQLSPGSAFQDSSYLNHNSNMSNNLSQRDYSSIQQNGIKAIIIQDRNLQMEKRRHTTLTEIADKKSPIFQKKETIMNEFNRPNQNEIWFQSQDPVDNDSPSVRFKSQQSPGSSVLGHQRLQIQPHFNTQNSSHPIEPSSHFTSKKIEDILVHNSILKKQNKGLYRDQQIAIDQKPFGSDNKLSKKSLVYNLEISGKQQKNSFSARTLLSKKIGRKVPRVDCNIEQVLDSKEKRSSSRLANISPSAN